MKKKLVTDNFYPVYIALMDMCGRSAGAPNIKELVRFHLSVTRRADRSMAFAWVRWDGDHMDAYSVEHEDWFTFLSIKDNEVQSAGLLVNMIAEGIVHPEYVAPKQENPMNTKTSEVTSRALSHVRWTDVPNGDGRIYPMGCADAEELVRLIIDFEWFLLPTELGEVNSLQVGIIGVSDKVTADGWKDTFVAMNTAQCGEGNATTYSVMNRAELLKHLAKVCDAREDGSSLMQIDPEFDCGLMMVIYDGIALV
jgi:hypothetical protein